MHAGISDISSDFEVIIDGPGGIPPGAGRIPIGMLRACCPSAASAAAATADRRELKGIPAVVKIAPPRTVLI